jgi:uncharacterized protein
MELIGDVAIAAPCAQVWAALNDPAVLQACIPGCEQVADESPDVRLVKLMVKMGPVRARFQGRVTLSDVLEPERCVMTFEGSGGAAGMASGRSQVSLIEEDGGAATRLSYTVKASVGGKLGQIGGRMMDASAKQLADQFFSALGARLAPVPVAAPDAPAVGPVTSVLTAAAPAAEAAPAALHANARQAVAPASAVVANASLNSEMHRLLWFVMGAASTGFGVWLGARLL